MIGYKRQRALNVQAQPSEPLVMLKVRGSFRGRPSMKRRLLIHSFSQENAESHKSVPPKMSVRIFLMRDRLEIDTWTGIRNHLDDLFQYISVLIIVVYLELSVQFTYAHDRHTRERRGPSSVQNGPNFPDYHPDRIQNAFGFKKALGGG